VIAQSSSKQSATLVHRNKCKTAYTDDPSSWPSCFCILCNSLSRKLFVHSSSFWGEGFSTVSAAWMAQHCNNAPFIPFLWVWVMRVMLLTSSWSHATTNYPFNKLHNDNLTNKQIYVILNTELISKYNKYYVRAAIRSNTHFHHF